LVLPKLNNAWREIREKTLSIDLFIAKTFLHFTEDFN